MTEATDRTPFLIGLTGGIASGKSTVADMFAELGVAVIDTDIIAREIVQRGQPALDEIRQRFGDGVLDAAGQLDRAAMRALIFADDIARGDLEAILHPRIGAEVMRRSALASGTYQVIVVPLLVGSQLADIVDRVLVVDCDEELQVQRLLARDAENEVQARRILAAQSSRDERLKIADDVILNDRGLGETRNRVSELDELYRRLATSEVRHEPPSETR